MFFGEVTLREKIIQRFFNLRPACAEIKTQQYDLSRGRVELSCDSELARVRSRVGRRVIDRVV